MNEFLLILIIGLIGIIFSFLLSFLKIKKLIKSKSEQEIKLLYKKSKKLYYRLSYVFLTYIFIGLILQFALRRRALCESLNIFYIYGLLIVLIIGIYFMFNYLQLLRRRVKGK